MAEELARYAALGRELRRIRSELATEGGEGLSQTQMADRLEATGLPGVSAQQPLVSRWESGRARPKQATLRAYAKLAGERPIRLLRLANYGWVERQPSAKSSPRLAFGAGLLLLAILAGSALTYSALSKPSTPTSVRVFPERVEAMARHRVLWSRDFPGWRLDYTFPPRVADLDGDGRREVLLDLHPGRDYRPPGKLVCLGEDGETRWEFQYGKRLRRGERVFEHSFRSRGLLWNEAQRQLILISRHALWYPTQVAWLDPETGRLLGEYWHPGYLESWLFYDLDQDGVDELLLGGLNNPGPGAGYPSLAVFDLPVTSGGSTPGFFGLPSVSPSAYLLLPQLEIYETHQELSAVQLLGVQGDRIVLGVGGLDFVTIHFVLSRQLELLEVRPTDTYVNLHDQLFHQGHLDHRFEFEELDAVSFVRRFDRTPDGNSLVLTEDPEAGVLE